MFEKLMETIANFFETTASLSAESTSLFILYQPKLPEVLATNDEDR